MGSRANDTIVVKTVARRVKLRRELLGIAQNDLARRVGLHNSAVAHIEAARRAPSLGKLVALARALGVSTDYLCGVATEAP